MKSSVINIKTAVLVVVIWAMLMWLPGLPGIDCQGDSDGGWGQPLEVYAAGSTGTASVPGFAVTLNGIRIDNASRKYPLLVYRDITYVPMTYSDSRFLGLESEWTAERGLVIKRVAGNSGASGTSATANSNATYRSEDIIKENKGTVSVQLASGPITINGKSINNGEEPYPLFTYKNVTYFPLTYRFTVGEFGWDYYQYTEAGGLVIRSAASGDKNGSTSESGGQNGSTTSGNGSTINGIPATSFAKGAQTYVSKYDGYSLMLPVDISIDESMAECRTIFEDEDYRLEVYREDCGSASKVNNYIVYSNAFRKDTVNFKVSDYGTQQINGRKVTYTVWTREEFTVLENDLNKYACFDIVSGTSVFTLMFKYNDSISLTRDLMPVVKSFATCGVTAKAPAIQVGKGSGAPMNSDTQAAYSRIFESQGSTSWGIFDYGACGGSYNAEKYAAFEAELGYQFPIQLVYSDFKMDPDTMTFYGRRMSDTLKYVSREGQVVVELTLQTVNRKDSKNMVFCALRGEYDDFLHAYAKEVAACGYPVMFRFGNEMNGDWCPYSGYVAGRDTEVYTNLYTYIYDIFQEEGVDNCIYIWNPNGKSYPDYKWNRDLMYYPGDQYVNVVGMTAYNTGTFYSSEKWRTFTQLYSDMYIRYSYVYSQPFMITEFACSGIGGDKAAWIRDMFNCIGKYDRIKAAVWWNSCDYTDSTYTVEARPYYLTKADGSFEAFKEGLTKY